MGTPNTRLSSLKHVLQVLGQIYRLLGLAVFTIAHDLVLSVSMARQRFVRSSETRHVSNFISFEVYQPRDRLHAETILQRHNFLRPLRGQD